MPRKVCVVITARPSYSRIRTALEAIRAHPDLELQIVVAASALLDKYGSALRVMAEEGFHVDRQVYMILEGENLVTSAKSTGLGIAELASVFADLKPDMVITVADRFETMATAIAASYMNLPLVHVQGGEVTGSIDEKVRHAITKLADVHLVSCVEAKERVVKMGEVADRVFVTGCPSIDLAKQAMAAEPRAVAETLADYTGVGAEVDLSDGYIVALQHPVTTEYEQAAEHAHQTLHAVHQGRWPTLWFWPNVDAGSDGTSSAIRRYREQHPLRQIHFYKNLHPLDFLSVLLNSRGIVGNSSVAIRECAYLGVPAVNIGSRQQGRDRGRNVTDVDYNTESISKAIGKMFQQTERFHDTIYGDGSAGQKIADTLAKCDLSIDKMLTY